MSGNPFFSGRIPPNLFERAEQHCDESGISKTELLIAALRAYLDYPEPPTPVEVAPERVTKLEEQMGEVWRAIAQLQNQNPEAQQQNLISDNVSTSNAKEVPAYLLNESAMARELGLTRNALRRRREKAQPKRKLPDNAEIGVIEEKNYYFWYWGNDEPEGKKPRHMWAAHPTDNSNDN